MRLVSSTLTLLLAFGLPSLTSLTAQASGDEVPQGQKNPDTPDGTVPEAGGDVATPPSSRNPSATARMTNAHGMTVQVLQDPIRIAPGEHGHLVLLVRIPRGRTVEKGGQVVLAAKQGPLNLGAPAWDPPAKGKVDYRDVLVIKVPLSIDGNAKYGKHPIQGSLRLRGDFHADNGPVAEAVADGSQADPASPPGEAVLGDPNRAEIPFQSPVHVGPPMPKPSRSHRKKADPVAGTRSGAAGGSGDPTSGASGSKGSAGPSDIVPAPGTAQRGGSEEAPLPVVGTEEAPDLADQDGSGIPWWMLSVALVVLAGLSFVLQARKT